jgi:hypothetical protein
MGQIQLDGNQDSQVFQIGEAEIYFSQDEQHHDLIVVAYSETGEPYSRTNQYIRFASLEEAERFLVAAQQAGGIPHGWQ